MKNPASPDLKDRLITSTSRVVLGLFLLGTLVSLRSASTLPFVETPSGSHRVLLVGPNGEPLFGIVKDTKITQDGVVVGSGASAGSSSIVPASK